MTYLFNVITSKFNFFFKLKDGIFYIGEEGYLYSILVFVITCKHQNLSL